MADSRGRSVARRRKAFHADLRGARRIKRLFRAIPNAMHEEFTTALGRAGRLLSAAMQDRAPKRTHALAAGLTARVLAKTLRLRVGLLGTPTGRSKLFYGRIQDLGRKAQTVTVRRFRAGSKREYDRLGHKTGPNVQSYQLRVKAMAPKRFVTGRFTALRAIVQQEVKGIWGRAIRAIGAGDD